MPATLQSLGIDKLTRDERIALALAIWDDIAAEDGRPLLTDTQRAELRRRVDDDDANPEDVVLWEQAKAQALARLKR